MCCYGVLFFFFWLAAFAVSAIDVFLACVGDRCAATACVGNRCVAGRCWQPMCCHSMCWQSMCCRHVLAIDSLCVCCTFPLRRDHRPIAANKSWTTIRSVIKLEQINASTAYKSCPDASRIYVPMSYIDTAYQSYPDGSTAYKSYPNGSRSQMTKHPLTGRLHVVPRDTRTGKLVAQGGSFVSSATK